MTSEELDELIRLHMDRANREDDFTNILELPPEDVRNRSARLSGLAIKIKRSSDVRPYRGQRMVAGINKRIAHGQ